MNVKTLMGEITQLSFERARDHCLIAFSQLSLLAKKFPDDKFEQVFNQKNLSRLLESMLVYETEKNILKEERIPDLRIAEYLVQYGLDILTKEYKNLSWYTPNLAAVTLNHLMQTRAICKDIAKVAEANQLEKKAKETMSRFLFKWKHIMNDDKVMLKNYILGLFDKKELRKMSVPTNLEIVHIEQEEATVRGFLADIEEFNQTAEEDQPNIFEGEFYIELNIAQSTAFFGVYIRTEERKKKLRIEFRNEDYYFYDKEEKSKKI